MLAQLKDISVSFPDKSVLDDVSLTVYPEDRLALVGENGSGKTTLLRILTGHLEPDAGDVALARGLRIGHLEQDFADLDREGHTCLEVALEPFAPLIRLEQRIDGLGAELATQRTQVSMDELLSELGEAQQSFEAAGGYGFRARTEAALSGLGLPEPYWECDANELSSGEKMRLALARLLLDEYDLLLLDEPTNHLDVPARVWLEEHLAGVRAAYVVASHDRRFLNRVATKVAHLDRDRKSTRLNSSHANISYAVFCLKKNTIRSILLLTIS